MKQTQEKEKSSLGRKYFFCPQTLPERVYQMQHPAAET